MADALNIQRYPNGRLSVATRQKIWKALKSPAHTLTFNQKHLIENWVMKIIPPTILANTDLYTALVAANGIVNFY